MNRHPSRHSKSQKSSKDQSKNYECLYVIGGRDGDILSSVSKYDSRTNRWIPSSPMPYPREDFGCAVIGRKIYICGGFNKHCLDDLTVYDTSTEQWTELRPMNYARQGCSMAVLDGFLYVAGGDDHGRTLSVVERYSVEDDRWEEVTPMTTKRGGLELVAMNGLLYAIGGYDQTDSLRSVERFDPRTNEWKAVASLKNRYLWFGSIVLHNRIYVVGGSNYEFYHPGVDEWYIMAVPNMERYGAVKLEVFNGKLMAIGVGSSFVQGSKVVKRFDFETKAWIPEADMNVGRCRHAVAVVETFEFQSSQVPKSVGFPNPKISEEFLENFKTSSTSDEPEKIESSYQERLRLARIAMKLRESRTRNLTVRKPTSRIGFDFDWD